MSAAAFAAGIIVEWCGFGIPSSARKPLGYAGMRDDAGADGRRRIGATERPSRIAAWRSLSSSASERAKRPDVEGARRVGAPLTRSRMRVRRLNGSDAGQVDLGERCWAKHRERCPKLATEAKLVLHEHVFARGVASPGLRKGDSRGFAVIELGPGEVAD